MTSSFNEYCNALAFLQQDQPKFESQVGYGDFVGLKHQQLVELGSKMLKNNLKLAKKGEEFANSLPPDSIGRLTHAIQEYDKLFYIPPPKLGGMLTCFKPKRRGDKYEQRLSMIKAKVVSATFLPIGILVDAKAEILNLESVKFSEYIAKMTEIFTTLHAVVTKGNDSVKEKARKDLILAMDSVRRFVDLYCESYREFTVEAKRRLRTVKETLESNHHRNIHQNGNDSVTSTPTNSQSAAPKQSTSLPRRLLVKAQSGLQEIMNSAALISLNKSKAALYATDDIQKYLKRERDLEVTWFTQLEDEMHDEASMQIFHQLREESEIVYNDANNKLRDGSKRWNTVKGQSYPRPVAVIEEPPPPQPQPSFPVPAQALAQTGKDIKKAANEGGKLAKDAVSGVKDMVQSVAFDVGKGVSGVGDVVKGVGSGAVNIAATGAKTAINVGNKAVQLPGKAAKELLGLDEPSSPPPSAKSSGNLNVFDKFPVPKLGNLLD